MHSKIYFGKIFHSRYQPVEHRFNYRTFMMYLDLDELPNLFERFWLWSYKKSNLAWFKPSDYMPAPESSKQAQSSSALSIKQAVMNEIKVQLGVNFTGQVCLLTHMRYFGYCFNPVSFYYCFNEQRQLQFIVAQINNTPWNERFCYVLDNRTNTSDKPVTANFKKAFHVSPFLDMDFDYQWRFSQPGEQLQVNMNNFKQGERWFNANLQLEASSLTSRQLAKALVLYPLMTMKVTGAIYWQALKLYIKGAVFQDHPDTPNNQTNKYQPINPSAVSTRKTIKTEER